MADRGRTLAFGIDATTTVPVPDPAAGLTVSHAAVVDADHLARGVVAVTWIGRVSATSPETESAVVSTTMEAAVDALVATPNVTIAATTRAVAIATFVNRRENVRDAIVRRAGVMLAIRIDEDSQPPVSVRGIGRGRSRAGAFRQSARRRLA